MAEPDRCCQRRPGHLVPPLPRGSPRPAQAQTQPDQAVRLTRLVVQSRFWVHAWSRCELETDPKAYRDRREAFVPGPEGAIGGESCSGQKLGIDIADAQSGQACALDQAQNLVVLGYRRLR